MKAELEIGDMLIFEQQMTIIGDALQPLVVVKPGSVARVQLLVGNVAWLRIRSPGDKGTPYDMSSALAKELVDHILDWDIQVGLVQSAGWGIFDADFAPPAGWAHIERDDELDFYASDWDAAEDHFDQVGSLTISRVGCVTTKRCVARSPKSAEAADMCKNNPELIGTQNSMCCGACNQVLRVVAENEWICDSCDGVKHD